MYSIENSQWSYLAGSQDSILPANPQLPHFPKNQGRQQKSRNKAPNQQRPDQILASRITTILPPDAWNQSITATRAQQPATVGPEKYYMSEAQSKDFKATFTSVLEVVREEMNIFIKEIYENNKKYMEMHKIVQNLQVEIESIKKSQIKRKYFE